MVGEEALEQSLNPRLKILKAFTISFVFLVSIAFAGVSHSQIPQAERDALVALYNSTDGANWKDNTGWNGAVGTECDWFGVTCSSGSVTGINLSWNSLSGSIPKEIGVLTKITSLNLGYNYSFIGRKTPKEPGLTGEIPRELGNLGNLTYLNLGWTNLTGTIPNELGKLTKLKTITLTWTQLSGPVPEGLQKIFPDPTSSNYWVDEELKFFRDVDQDGIDDQIDLDLESSAPIKTINEPDYSISISGSGRVVNLVSPFLFSEINQNTYLPWEIGKQIGKIIYSHFNDEFDFLFLSTNIKYYNTDTTSYLGLFRQIKNSTSGLGGLNNWAKIFDDSDLYGSDGKLQGIVHFPYILGINQVGLHEIMHHWANYIIETGEIGHWGYTNIGGQLGGWKPNTLEKLNDGNYKTSGPLYTFWTGRSTNKNLLPYSDFELYLMGLIGADEVGHDIKIAQDFNWVDSSNGIFEASSIETITMDEIIAKNGKREPSYLTSQKDFTAMYVVISEQPLTRQEWISVDRSIFNFQLKGDDGYPGYNFWEATQGKATLEFGQLDTYLTSQASLSYLVTFPVVSIVGGDKTISDTDNAAGESVSFTAAATDDGTIVTTQWLVDGAEVATGLSASLSLPNGSTVVTFKATDDGGTSSTTTATITVEAPAYTPTEEWPSPYNGVTPDPSLELAFNNIGIFNTSDSTIYTCLRLFTNGVAVSTNGIGEFDIGLNVVSLSEATVQITKFREFNTIGALNEKVQAPDCSGQFETTTSLYTDIIQVNSSVLETVWSLIDSTNLILKLVSSKELTAN